MKSILAISTALGIIFNSLMIGFSILGIGVIVHLIRKNIK